MSDTVNAHKNRLAGEKSPYLLQHAENPVDWYPWGGEVFEKARSEDLPVFLSIGYSTCHWCHVMERESFENEAVAVVLNENFVSIKVDREERPDIDAVYISVCQAMTGGGGWPLTIVMTPDKKPFFAATYLPPDDPAGRKFGVRGLTSVLKELSDAWKNRRNDVTMAAEKTGQFIESASAAAPGPEAEPGFGLIEKAFKLMDASYDEEHGGFGQTGPKFPTAHMLSLLLRYWRRTGDRRALDIAVGTLGHINRGGIHDHVGGGFARYSVDRRWLVPHFEKMLYDQAILARAFIEAYQATGDERHAGAARDTFEYVLRDLVSQEGAFLSAEDADSEGEEGRFYVWTKEEIGELVPGKPGEIFAEFYGVTADGNFENGKNVLYETEPRKQFAERKGLEPGELEEILREGRETLYRARGKRVRPHLDDKVLVSWNALMISALALGARVLGEEKYSAAASRAAEFILDRMYEDGVLYRRYRDGHRAVHGFLDDYAFLAVALLELYETTFDYRLVVISRRVADGMIDLFSDDAGGGFFLDPAGSGDLPGRTRDAYDGAEPSGNSMAVLALLRLGIVTGDGKYTEEGLRTIYSFAGMIERYPPGFSQMLIALDFYLSPPVKIVISGGTGERETKALVEAARSGFATERVVVMNPAGGDAGERPPGAESMPAVDGRATAYVCSGTSCNPPVHDAGKMLELCGIEKSVS